jgi:hypothetical protein
MTNIIAFLHTTIAYQSAALNLMVGQANFDAQQLHLNEPLPIVAPASTNDWKVALPLYGVTGGFSTSNYVYQFKAGKLVWIQKRPQRRNPTSAQPSLVDTNGAYQLATQWLAGISVDVPALERQYPHSSVQFGSRPVVVRNRNPVPGVRNRTAIIATNTVKSPIFLVTWGSLRDAQASPEFRPSRPVTMEILGSTKQCTGLHIQNPDLLQCPPLQVTNAAALLGTPLPPQHYVAEFLGGQAAYDVVAQPDTVTAWLLGSQPGDPDSKANRTPAVAVNALTAGLFSQALTDFNSYSWLEDKNCTPDYGVRLRFTKGGDTVEFLLCYECDSLQVTHNGQSAQKDCDFAHNALVKAIQSIFPTDNAIRNLKLHSQPK